MGQKTIHVSGMHCHSCELLIEEELLKVPGIQKAVVKQNKGTADIYFQGQLDESLFDQAVCNAGYTLGLDNKPFFSKNINDYKELFLSFLLIFNLFFLAKSLGILNIDTNHAGNYSSLPVVFLVGLTAGISTCMALVGGLVLGASANFAKKHPLATSLEKFKPHVFFNFGRIISYTLLGALIGYLGSFFQLSTSVLGILIIIVGLVMLLLGLQLTDISPRLKNINFSLPSGIAKLLGIKERKNQEYSHTNSLLMGALTFFLPCGFTQAMQLYAMSTGSPTQGALILGTFALGTAPGLLGIGGLTSLLKGAIARYFFKTAGLVVTALAIFNIINGYNLAGLNIVSSILAATRSTLTSTSPDKNVTLENGVQIVRMNQTGSGYTPNRFTIKKDIPVKWIITSLDSQTCASSIVSDKLGVRASLKSGDNVFEFTPKEVGSIRFSCLMGMYTGSFNVVDDSNPSAPTAVSADLTPPPSGSSCGGSGGCGCGAKRTTDNADIQVLKATYSYDSDIQPNQFILKAGKPAQLEILAKDDGVGCMGSVTLPGLTDKVDVFTKGQTVAFEFTPAIGTYNITCGMGIPRGPIIFN